MGSACFCDNEFCVLALIFQLLCATAGMVVYQKPLREHAPSINSPVMDKERWGLVLCAPFSALDTGI